MLTGERGVANLADVLWRYFELRHGSGPLSAAERAISLSNIALAHGFDREGSHGVAALVREVTRWKSSFPAANRVDFADLNEQVFGIEDSEQRILWEELLLEGFTLIRDKDISLSTLPNGDILNLDILSALLEQGNNINTVINRRFSDGSTPFLRLLKFSNVDVKSIMYMLDHGAMLGARDNEGHTALMYALLRWESNSYNVIASLIEKGFPVDETDDMGRTALFHACSRRRRLAALSLLDHGANLNLLRPGTYEREFAEDVLAQGHRPDLFGWKWARSFTRGGRLPSI